MGSAMPAAPLWPLLFQQHRTTITIATAAIATTRLFHISRHKNTLKRWRINNNNNNQRNDSGHTRLPFLHFHRFTSLRPLLSFRPCSSIPFPPLRPLLQPCSPSLPTLLISFMSTTATTTTPQAGSDPSAHSSSSNKTVRVVIKGRVQGVFYRNWTVENARQLGLKGWVRNRRDGSVEALFSGDPDKVQEMEQRCRRGPPDAMVTGLQGFPCDEDPGTGFERRPTA